MPGLLQKPLFRGLFKNPVPISLLPSLPPSLPPHYTTPSEILAPREHSFQPEPRTSRCPLAKEAQCWALGKCLQTSLPFFISLLSQQNLFPFAIETRLHPKVSHKLKKRKMKKLYRRIHKSCRAPGQRSSVRHR